jgi:N-carbamoyl-L-amino-acid hydrolase
MEVNRGRLLATLNTLAKIGGTPEGGVNRPAYSDADLAGRAKVRDMMKAAGLTVRVDAGGNTFATRAGRDANVPPILIGSHTDSVPQGGRFDGALGVAAALEVAFTLRDAAVELRHPLEVVDFQNEEGGLIGSKIAVGKFDRANLPLVTASGFTIADGIARLGGDASRLDSARRVPGSIAAYVELHIEQGRVLERANANIGVVEGLVAIRYWEVVFAGVASHAGTTPMPDRHDALLAASRFVDAVHRVVTSTPGRHVGTVGRLAVFPGGANVVPGRVVLTLELRDLDVAVIMSLFERVRLEGERIASANGTSVSFQATVANEPSLTDERVRDAIASVATDLGLRPHLMPSGAGHDAQNMAAIAPSGMIFVPSVDGISHSPKELTVDDDVVNGANVLLATVVRLDTSL